MSVAKEGGWGPIRLGEWHGYGLENTEIGALCPFRPVWNSHVNWNSQPPGTYCMYYVCVSVSPRLGGEDKVYWCFGCWMMCC